MDTVSFSTLSLSPEDLYLYKNHTNYIKPTTATITVGKDDLESEPEHSLNIITRYKIQSLAPVIYWKDRFTTEYSTVMKVSHTSSHTSIEIYSVLSDKYPTVVLIKLHDGDNTVVRTINILDVECMDWIKNLLVREIERYCNFGNSDKFGTRLKNVDNNISIYSTLEHIPDTNSNGIDCKAFCVKYDNLECSSLSPISTITQNPEGRCNTISQLKALLVSSIIAKPPMSVLRLRSVKRLADISIHIFRELGDYISIELTYTGTHMVKVLSSVAKCHSEVITKFILDVADMFFFYDTLDKNIDQEMSTMLRTFKMKILIS